MSKKQIVIHLLLLTTTGLPLSSQSSEIVTTTADQNKLAITVYQQNLALVKDTRRIHLNNGLNQLAWHEISAQMQSETALLRNKSQPEGFILQEQNFDFDLLTPQKLLEKYTGKAITVIRTNSNTGIESKEAATVLTTNGGVILQFEDRVETGIPGRLSFPEIPNTLHDKPTLTASFTQPTTGQQDLELTYLTAGLSWQANYIVELNNENSHISLSGLATLINQSGVTFKNTHLQLVAGHLNRVSHPQVPQAKRMALASAPVEHDTMHSDELFEYHRYTLPQTTTLENNQEKQVAFLVAKQIPVDKTFLLQGENYYYSSPYHQRQRNPNITAYISFKNSGENLNVPLPEGIMRTYLNDTQGELQFIGEDRIHHTPKNDTVRLKLGHAFDITAERKQTDFKKLPTAEKQHRHYETAHEVTLKNTKKEIITLEVREPIPGDWDMLSESLPHQKIASNLAQWQIKLPPESETILTYRVRVKF